MEAAWTPCRSSAVEAYRYLETDAILQLVFHDGRQLYDYPCERSMYDAFLNAPSKGRFVTEVLKPNAQRLGWSRPPRRWRG